MNQSLLVELVAATPYGSLVTRQQLAQAHSAYGTAPVTVVRKEAVEDEDANGAVGKWVLSVIIGHIVDDGPNDDVRTLPRLPEFLRRYPLLSVVAPLPREAVDLLDVEFPTCRNRIGWLGWRRLCSPVADPAGFLPTGAPPAMRASSSSVHAE
jgi:hypothetical protein